MELRHLRYFAAVAEEEHVGRAAARLRVAQPALSRQVRQLEEELGVPLFAREGRGLRLTAAGRELREGARRTLQAAADAGTRARAVARGEVGRLTVGFVDTTTYSGAVPRLFQRFRAQFPGITLTLAQMTSMEQWQALREGRIQIGFVYHLPAGEPGMGWRRLHGDEVVLALPRAHRLARARGLSLAALAGEGFVWFPRAVSPRYYDIVAAACARRGLTMNVVQEATNDATIVSLVAGGMGVTFTVGSWRHVKPAALVLRRLPDLGIRLQVSALWRTDDDTPALRSFLSVVGARS